MIKKTSKLRTLLLAILLACCAAIALPAHAQPDAQSDAQPDMVLTLTDVSPAVLQPGDPLTLRGTIQNTTDEPIVNPTISLVLQQVSPTSSSMADIEGWISGVDDWRTTRLTWQDSGQTIEPGATAPWTLALPADQSPFDAASQWGPRGIQVEFVSGGVTASVRSVVLWHPGPELPIPVADVALILPLSPTSNEWQQSIGSGLPVSEIAGPRLLKLIEQFDQPEVAWALDPALLARPDESFNTDAGTDPEPADPSPQSTDSEADAEDPDPGTEFPDADPNLTYTPELLAALTSGSRVHEVVLLPWGNADLNLLTTPEVVQGDGRDIASEVITRGEELAKDHGIRFQPQITWPVQAPTFATLSTLDAVDRHTLILRRSAVSSGTMNSGAPTLGSDSDSHTSSGNLPTVNDGLSFTRGQISTDAGRFQSIIIDEITSPALVTSEDPLQNRQLSLSAIAYAVRGSLDESLLLSLPGEPLSDGELAALNSALLAIDQSPFSDVMPLRTIVGDTDTQEHGLATPAPVDTALDPGIINDLGAALTQLYAIAEVVPEDVTVQGAADEIYHAFASPLAHIPSARQQLISTATQHISEMNNVVGIETGSTLNLISQRGDVPVTVRNDAHYPATVTVELRPGDLRLTAEETETITIPARTAVTTRIPVTAIANGNVEVLVQLRSESGSIVGEPQSFSMRVRADWENTGTAIAAGAVGLVFITGLVRSIIRSRSSKDSSAHGK